MQSSKSWPEEWRGEGRLSRDKSSVAVRMTAAEKVIIARIDVLRGLLAAQLLLQS